MAKRKPSMTPAAHRRAHARQARAIRYFSVGAHCPNCGHELHPKPVALTPHQLRMLEFICRHIAERGIAPSHDDIAAELGLKSKSVIQQTIGILKLKGWIRHYPYRARAIGVLYNPWCSMTPDVRSVRTQRN